MPDRDTMLGLAEARRRFIQPARSHAYRAGDMIYLGEGITWRVSASLASSLNRQIARDSLRFFVRARAQIGGQA